MRAWLIYGAEGAERNRDYIELYFEECKARGISLTLLIAERLVPRVRSGGMGLTYEGKELSAPDFAVMRHPSPFLSEYLEAMGIPLFNSAKVSRVANDKRKAYQMAKSLGLPVPDSIFPPRGTLEMDMEFPAVIKPAWGRGGKDVYLVNTKEECGAALERLQNEDVVVQRAVSDLGRDLRVYVIGGEIIAAVMRESKEDFRANYSLGGSARLYDLRDEEQAMAEKIIAALDPGYIGIDFIFDGGSPIFNEIEDAVGARALFKLTKINPVALYLDFILKKIGE